MGLHSAPDLLRAIQEGEQGGKEPPSSRSCLPCPFCGGRKTSIESLSSAWGDSGEAEHAVCDTCGSSAPVDAWLKRASLCDGPDTTLSCDQIVKLKSALTWLGHSTPESMEECAAKQKSLVLALIREVEGLKKEMRVGEKRMQLDPSEIDTVRQWFDSVHDVTPTYLRQGDYELAKRIYDKLGWRVPESIRVGEAALCKLLARREEITRLIQSKYQGVSVVSIGEEDPAHVIFTFPGGAFRGRWIVGQDTVLLPEDDHPAWEEFRRNSRKANHDGEGDALLPASR